uniref:Microspherule protein 1 n=1 Tax=Aceria tosichella TaxID=561515 RepID=A0A6G1SEW9_9ACAR
MSLAAQRSKRNTRAPARFEDEPDHPTPSPITANDGPKKQKRRRLKNARDLAMRELGRWKPADDLALILAVQQRNNLEEVWRGVKFSCKFSFQEVEERWYALLYCAPIQRVAMAAMRQLPSDIVALIHAKTLFSREEEELLATITIPPNKMTYVPPLETFKQLLESNSHVFVPFRTDKHLRTHWLAMRYYNLIPVVMNGKIITPRREEMPTFSEVEETVDKDILNTLSDHIATNFDGQTVASKLKDDPIHQELMVNSRRIKKEIRKLENEIPKWQALVDRIRGTSESDFSDSTSNIAVLRGRHMRYLMQLNQITFGRCTKDSIVDVDLSLEGPAKRISRRQGMIELQSNGEFVIINTGRRPFYVDSQPVLEGGNCTVIHNNSVVEIDGLRFVFLVNLDLIAKLKQTASEPQIKN